MTKVRNVFHVILGFVLAYYLIGLTEDFNNFFRYFIGIIGGFFIGAVIGVGIEGFQNKVLKQIFDEMDILRTMIGGILGGLFVKIYPNINFINKWLLWACLSLCVVELVRIAVYKFMKK